MDALKIAVYRIREEMVVLDSDLATLYGVKTSRLNQQVRRNADRFPEDFAFTLTAQEKSEVVAKCNNPKKVLYFRGLPMVFTEHGALMAATVLNSPLAARMGIFMVRAFVRMRRELAGRDRVSQKLAEIDKTLLIHDEGLRDLYQKLMPLLEPRPEPERRKIGFGD
jgi:ORF6N domain